MTPDRKDNDYDNAQILLQGDNVKLAEYEQQL